MKFRQRLIADYKLLGLDLFIKKYKKDSNVIRVKWALDGTITHAGQNFEMEIEIAFSRTYAKPIGSDKGISSRFHHVEVAAWIVLMFDYLEGGESKDFYIWID
jgi:hypothetical protein